MMNSTVALNNATTVAKIDHLDDEKIDDIWHNYLLLYRDYAV